jgi:succinoglycan biosynthesis protein ExoH
MLLVGTQLGFWLVRMSKYSFFMFLAHAPVLMVSSLLYKRIGGSLPYPVYWFLAPILVTVVLIGVYRLAYATMPGLFGVLIGAGTQPKAIPTPDASGGPGVAAAATANPSVP